MLSYENAGGEFINFEQLKKYLSDKNLVVGSHCTNLRFIDSIKKFGISHER